MTHQASSDETPPAPSSIFPRHRVVQTAVVIASAACFMLFWYAGRWIGIPNEPGYQDSLLQQQWPVVAVLGTYVMLIAAMALGTLLAGRFWFFAGIFAMAVGLTALSGRGGPMRFVLFHAAAVHARTIFPMLFIEQCLLFAPIALLWSIVADRYLAAVDLLDATPRPASNVGAIVTAVAAQVVMTGVVMEFLAPTDAKKQVLVAAFLAGLTGTMVAEHFFTDPRALRWYWIGPFLAGAVGYLAAAFSGGTWQTGDPGGSLAPLAHPLPLDYASGSIAGALLGYWMSAERPGIPFLWSRPVPAPTELAPAVVVPKPA